MKFIMILLITVMVPVFLTPIPLAAQKSEIPTYLPIHFFRHNDPQSIGMGSTGSSFRTGLMAGYVNPAGLSEMTYYAINYSYYPSARFLGNMWEQHGVSIGVPLPFGFKSGFYFTYNDLGKQLNGSITKYQISIARKIYHFSFGLSARNYREFFTYYIDDFFELEKKELNIKKWFFDLGVRSDLTLIDNKLLYMTLNLGGTYSNLGPADSYEYAVFDTSIRDIITMKGKEPHPNVLQAGFAFKTALLKDNKINPEILLAVENRRLINTDRYINWNYIISGAELLLYKSIFGRLGYSHKVSSRYNYSGWTYGIGFKTPEKLSEQWPVTLGLSYSRGNAVGILNRNLINAEIMYQR